MTTLVTHFRIWAFFTVYLVSITCKHLLRSLEEGLDGRLPNQDVYNSLAVIARHTEQVPIVLYDHLDPRDGGNWNDWLGNFSFLSNMLDKSSELQEYAVRAKNIFRLASYQAFGDPSGAHGLYHK